MNPFESSLSDALIKPAAGKVLLAAVSGGADSNAMLVGLAALREGAGFSLHCAHVEHGIRPTDESLGDAEAVKALCVKLNVPCRVISVPPGRIAAYAGKGGPGIEGAARHYRLRALAREALRLKADWVLTGHTRDDLLETLLMRILRGSGPAGLGPMPRVRGRRLRPLLELTRRDVLEYLEKKDIPYRIDSTNSDIRYLRNRVRLKLIPVLDSFFPSWRTSLLAMAETQALTAEFLSAEVCKRLTWEAGPPEAGASLCLREDDFFNSPLILREEAVFNGTDMLATICKKGKQGHPPRRASLRRAVGREPAEREPAERGTTEDLGPVRLERKDGFVVLKPAAKARPETGFSLLIKEAGAYTLRGEVSGLGKDLLINAGSPATCKRTDETFGFTASYPVVFRNHGKGDCIFMGGRKRRFRDILDRFSCSVYTRVITVSDKKGPAAFITIGEELTVISREEQTTDCSFFGVSMKRGGTDAKRSER